MLPIRYLICCLCTLVGVVTFLTRFNINIAIVAMVPPIQQSAQLDNDTILCPHLLTEDEMMHEGGNKTSADDPPTDADATHDVTFDWSPEQQGSVLGSFFWTHCICLAFAGSICTRLGGRSPVAVSLLVSAVLSAIGPVVARSSIYLFIACRMLLGMAQATAFSSRMGKPGGI